MLSMGRSAAAQPSRHSPRPATTAEVIAGNVLIGGLVAATRALFSDADPLRAFALGALGGGVHLGGKNLSLEPGVAKAWSGLLVSNLGTSMVANAGRGVRLFDEISIPLAATRVRVTPFEQRKVRVALNLFESAVIARLGSQDGLELDWRESFSRGALMFIARDKRVFFGDEEVNGFALAPTAVVSSFAGEFESVVRHEMVHVHQQWFLQESIGRPLEDAMRKRMKYMRLIPRWLEIGGIGPAILLFDDRVIGERGLGRALQAEAEMLERR